MKRAVISVIILLTLLSVTSTSVNNPHWTFSNSDIDPTFTDEMQFAEVQQSGSNVPVIQYLNRSYTEQLTTISNSYTLPDTHESTIDLSSYQIPGWTLSKVIIDMKNMTAIAERELVGTSATPLAGPFYSIYEHLYESMNCICVNSF